MILQSKKYEFKRLKLIAEEVIGDKILDIGHAQLPNPYLKKYYVTGYDQYSSLGDHDYDEEHQGDIYDILDVLKGKKYDTVICGEVIEHLKEPYDFLSKVNRMLAEDGLFILSTPNPLSFPLIFFEALMFSKYFYSSDHKYLFPPRWVLRMLDLSGFEIVKVKSVGLSLLFTVPWCPAIMSYQLIYIARTKK